MANRCRPVQVVLKGDVAKVLKDVTTEAAKHDIEIKGDETKGTIKHKKIDVSGTYVIDKDKKITIQMTEDSIWASCTEIENGLRDFFQGK